MTELQLGVYRHYKGGLYHVFGEAVHSETKELLVLYKRFNETLEEKIIHAHPKKMFLQQIRHDGKYVLRFEYQG